MLSKISRCVNINHFVIKTNCLNQDLQDLRIKQDYFKSFYILLKILNPFLSFNPVNPDSDRNMCKDEHQGYCDPGRFMLLILTIVQAETSFGCWPEKAQQRVESLVG